MSGTRRTEEFTTIQTQVLTLRDPEFIGVLAVTDGHGSIQPSNDITLNSITAGTITAANGILQSDIIAADISSTAIQTDTMEVSGLTKVTELESNNIVVDRVIATNTKCKCMTSNVMRVSTFSVGLIVAEDISSATKLTMVDISANSINVTGAAKIDLIRTEQLYANVINTNNSDIIDISASNGILGVSTIENSTSRRLVSNQIFSTNLATPRLSVLGDLSVNNVTVQGTFTYDELTLASLTTANVTTTDISTNQIKASSAVAASLTATKVDVSRVNVSQGLIAQSLLSSFIEVATDVSSSNVLAATTNIPGNTTMATGVAQSMTSPLIITPAMTVTNTYTTTELSSSSTINYNGGVLTYIPTSGLLVNGIPISCTQALYPIPFSPAVISNNLATMTDISSTLTSVITTLNAFMNIFSTRALIIAVSPQYKFNSNQSIQFIINGTKYPDIIINKWGLFRGNHFN